MAKNWYVAQIHTGQWRVAQRHLDQQSFLAWFPCIGLKPLFPGYVFLHMDLEDEPWGSINGTRGVIRLLPAHVEEPLPLPIGFMDDLIDLVNSGAFEPKAVEDLMLRFAPGDAVRVVAGAFVGHIGNFQRYRKGMLEILMRLLGSEIIVKVPSHQVEPPSISRRSLGAAATG